MCNYTVIRWVKIIHWLDYKAYQKPRGWQPIVREEAETQTVSASLQNTVFSLTWKEERRFHWNRFCERVLQGFLYCEEKIYEWHPWHIQRLASARHSRQIRYVILIICYIYASLLIYECVTVLYWTPLNARSASSIHTRLPWVLMIFETTMMLSLPLAAPAGKEQYRWHEWLMRSTQDRNRGPVTPSPEPWDLKKKRKIKGKIRLGRSMVPERRGRSRLRASNASWGLSRKRQ